VRIGEERVLRWLVGVAGEGTLREKPPKKSRMRELDLPSLPKDDLARLRRNILGDFRACTLPMLFPPGDDAGASLRRALDKLCKQAQAAIEGGASILILSDRDVGPDQAPIPSLLAVAAVHHHLIRTGQRVRAGLVVESAEPREVSHLCLLIGYGAGAVNPYLALETVASFGLAEGCEHYIKALKKGLLKTMSKMGISAVASYQGAQIFEAVGIDQVVIDRYFTGTSSRVRGIGLDEIAEEALV